MGIVSSPAPRLIRRRASVELVADVDVHGQGELLVMAPSDVGPEARSRVLEAVASGHDGLGRGGVPRFKRRARFQGREAVVLDCAAVCDLEHVLARLAETGRRIPHEAGGAFVDWLHDAVEAGHHAPGSPRCLGAIGWGNVLVDREGELFLVGLGQNFSRSSHGAAASGAAGIVQAPEVSLGLAPTPRSDVFAAHGFVLGLLEYVRLPDSFGVFERQDEEARDLRRRTGAAIDRLAAGALAADPLDRPADIAALRALYEETRATIGIAELQGAPDALRAFCAETVREILAEGLGGEVVLGVSADGTRVVLPGGETLDLSRRRALRGIVRSLVEHKASGDATALGIEALRDAGWPGERMGAEAARSRVYVAVSSLRRMGLGELVEHVDEGYRLRASVRIELK